jgi:hypothetical protein
MSMRTTRGARRDTVLMVVTASVGAIATIAAVYAAVVLLTG